METVISEGPGLWAILVPLITAVAGIVVGFGWSWAKKAAKASPNTVDDAIIAAIEKAVRDNVPS